MEVQCAAKCPNCSGDGVKVSARGSGSSGSVSTCAYAKKTYFPLALHRYSADGTKAPASTRDLSLFSEVANAQRSAPGSPLRGSGGEAAEEENPAAREPYRVACVAAAGGSFEAAAAGWLEACDLGHALAARKLGFAALCGRGVARSDDQAAYFLQRAGSLGDRPAMTAMGSLYSLGRFGGATDDREPYPEAAAALWLKASKLGCQLAGLKLATLLLSGVDGVVEAVRGVLARGECPPAWPHSSGLRCRTWARQETG